MTDQEQRKVFASNLTTLLAKDGKNQNEVAKALGVSPQTFNNWAKGHALPRMGRVQQIADYFGVQKTDLIDDKERALSPENALLVAKIRRDPDLADMVKRYLELPKEERRHVRELVAILSASQQEG